jgi:hypothetical protein
MQRKQLMTTARVRAALRWSAAVIGLVAGSYAAYVGVAWSRYGHTRRARDPEDQDELLDRFMPDYEVRGSHQAQVSAPAAITLAAARDMDLLGMPVVRAIVRGRELVLGSTPDDQPRPRGLLREMQALGWGVLAEVSDREIVMGAVTQPWKADVVFRALPPNEFSTFDEPGYVKIVWTLRADRLGAADSLFRTETRAVATDPKARAKFRWYWSFFSPGMALIRWVSLAPLKREAQRRAEQVHEAGTSTCRRDW